MHARAHTHTHTHTRTHTHTPARPCLHPCASQLKMAALREDDNVFDVSYEGQGEEGATASATDVKVHRAHPCMMHCFCYMAMRVKGPPRV